MTFKQAAKDKGYTLKELGKRWGNLTQRQMSNISKNPKKIHWDALDSLPNKRAV